MTSRKRKSESSKAESNLPQETNEVSANTVMPQQVPLLYADGIGNVLLSPINTRVTFIVNHTPLPGGAPQSAPTMQVVIPTTALISFVQQFERHLTSQGAGLLKAYDGFKEQLERQMQKEPT